MAEEIHKLNEFELECTKFFGDDGSNPLESVELTRSNITVIVGKINEIIDFINQDN